MSYQTSVLSDDVVIQIIGDKFPAKAGPTLRSTGWRGGTWVMYIEPTGTVDEYLIEKSNGTAATGFLVWPSEDYHQGSRSGPVNNWTAKQLRPEQGSVAGSSTVAITTGGGRFAFSVYETLAIGPGGVRDGSGGDAVYTLNGALKVSENGLLCSDPDARLALVGVAEPLIVGVCSAVPHARNGFRVGLDLKF